MQSNNIDQLAKDRAWLLKYYKSTECLCEKSKKTETAFCYGCYKALPRNLQRQLYRRFGQGFEEAVNESVIYLQQNIW